MTSTTVCRKHTSLKNTRISEDAGIGRQACLRGMCELSREGSSPFPRTKIAYNRSGYKLFS